MKHLDDGLIRAALDDQLGDAELRHLRDCPRCQNRLEALRVELQPAARRLGFLASPPDGAGADARAALTRFYHRYQNKKENSMFRKLFASRALRFGLAAALLLALVLSIPSTRAWAGQFLGIFRVQQVTVLPVDTSGIEKLSGNRALGQHISNLIASSVDVTREAGDPLPAADAAEASRQAGFNVRLPASAASVPALTVSGGAAFTMTIDRAKAQALLDEAGRTDLVLPESLDGAEIQVNIPAGVSAAYGVCPEDTGEEEIEGETAVLRRKYGDCLLLSQVPSPTVNTPPNVDFRQMAGIGLQFIGMSREEAETFSQKVDWTSSLVIPIPRNAATYQTVQVDGVEGQLIECAPSEDYGQFTLIWVKDGIVHAIAGWGDRAGEAMEMANSLR